MILRTFHTSASVDAVEAWADRHATGYMSIHEICSPLRGRPSVVSVTLTEEDDCIHFMLTFPSTQYSTEEMVEESDDTSIVS